MIRSNLRLVVKIAHDYANLGLPLLDLISEGNIGLMKAVERFDPAKGGKLSTYAAWWIKQSIKRALANQSKTIRLPVHLVDKISKMRRVSLQMSEELGREPTDEELGDEIGIASGKVSQLKTVRSVRLRSMRRSATTIRPSSAKSSATKRRRRPLSCCATRICAMKSAGCSTCSTIARRRSSSQRFGLDGGKPKTLEEVGQEIRRYARAHSPVAEHRAFEAAPRAQQERAAGRRRIAGRGLSLYARLQRRGYRRRGRFAQRNG